MSPTALSLSLSLFPKQFLPREPPPVIEFSVREDAEEGGLAGVHVTHDGHADLHKVLLFVTTTDLKWE
jgi:hypothetical protein